MNPLISNILSLILALLIMSFGLGMIVGGPKTGLKFVQWELRKLSDSFRWILRKIIDVIIDFFSWIKKGI